MTEPHLVIFQRIGEAAEKAKRLVDSTGGITFGEVHTIAQEHDVLTTRVLDRLRAVYNLRVDYERGEVKK